MQEANKRLWSAISPIRPTIVGSKYRDLATRLTTIAEMLCTEPMSASGSLHPRKLKFDLWRNPPFPCYVIILILIETTRLGNRQCQTLSCSDMRAYLCR